MQCYQHEQSALLCFERPCCFHNEEVIRELWEIAMPLHVEGFHMWAAPSQLCAKRAIMPRPVARAHWRILIHLVNSKWIKLDPRDKGLSHFLPLFCFPSYMLSHSSCSNAYPAHVSITHIEITLLSGVLFRSTRVLLWSVSGCWRSHIHPFIDLFIPVGNLRGISSTAIFMICINVYV